MIRRRSILLILSTLFCGCASTAPEDVMVDPNVAESALETSFKASIAAIEFTRSSHSPRHDTGTSPAILIGDKRKVKRLKDAMKHQGRGAFCAVKNETEMTIFDAKGDVVGSGTLDCFRGTIALARGGTVSVVFAPHDLQVLDEPLVVADALWGIEKAVIEQGSPHAPVSTRAITAKGKIADLVESVSPAQAIDEEAPRPRCAASRTISFYRQGREAARLAYRCASTASLPARIDATFVIYDRETEAIIDGGISIDPRPAEALLQ